MKPILISFLFLSIISFGQSPDSALLKLNGQTTEVIRYQIENTHGSCPGQTWDRVYMVSDFRKFPIMFTSRTKVVVGEIFDNEIYARRDSVGNWVIIDPIKALESMAKAMDNLEESYSRELVILYKKMDDLENRKGFYFVDQILREKDHLYLVKDGCKVEIFERK